MGRRVIGFNEYCADPNCAGRGHDDCLRSSLTCKFQSTDRIIFVCEKDGFKAFRSYYEYLSKGVVKVEYTVRLNNVGDFAMPPSRVEALYAPEMFGEIPNARVKVEAVK